MPRKVRDLLRIIKADGWKLVAQKGSHRQFKHPTKKGRVTVPHPVKDVTQFVLKRISEQSGIVFT